MALDDRNDTGWGVATVLRSRHFFDASNLGNRVASPIEFVVNTSELASGYAADAYARVNGIGCACVTYAVGALSARALVSYHTIHGRHQICGGASCPQSWAQVSTKQVQ